MFNVNDGKILNIANGLHAPTPHLHIQPSDVAYHYSNIPQTVLALGVLTVLLRALERWVDPVALPASIFPCNLQYLVTPTLKNTQQN